jgi:inner membrane protein
LDNISHSLMSIAIAATIARKSSPRLRKAAMWTAFLAGNLPDIDVVTTIMGDQAKLVYLLHHRGHTHTILYVLITGLIIGWVASWVFKKRNPTMNQGEKKVLFVTAVSCSALHLFMDWWNIYGVHPFYPFDNKWYYGDAIFIVEPLIWVSLAPLCFFLSEKKFYQGLSLVVPAAAISLTTLLVGPITTITVVIFFVSTFIWEWKKPSHNSGLIICTIALVTFFIGAQSAKHSTASGPAVPQGANLLESAVSPAPANPFCWKFYSMSVDENDYIVRTGVFSLLPTLVSPTACMMSRWTDKTVNFLPLENSSKAMNMEGEYRISRADFKAALANCEFSALMIFARIPFIVKDSLTGETIFGDLRFDNEKGLGFSEFSLNSATTCPGLNIPPWVPPRLELLE